MKYEVSWKQMKIAVNETKMYLTKEFRTSDRYILSSSVDTIVTTAANGEQFKKLCFDNLVVDGFEPLILTTSDIKSIYVTAKRSFRKITMLSFFNSNEIHDTINNVRRCTIAISKQRYDTIKKISEDRQLKTKLKNCIKMNK